MEKISGEIKAIKQRDKNYSLLIDDKWLSGFGKCPFEKNNEVTIEYEVSGRFNNIKQIEGDVTDKGNVKAEIVDKRTDDIHLQVCIKAAATILSTKTTTPTPFQVSEFAKGLKKEVWG